MPAANPLAIFAPRLNASGVRWMAVGSIASNAYGEARTTLDLDVVMVIPAQNARRFAAAFPEESFYCPPPDVIEIEASRSKRGHFNVIDHATMFKADVYIAGGDPFEGWAFRNRRQLSVEETADWIAPPEYVAIHKLEFFREGGSEKHLRDIRGMLAVTDLDRAVIEREARERGLLDQWQLCLGGG
jgi:hypothetical protein